MDVKEKNERIRRAGELEGWLEDVAWEENIHKPLRTYREGLVLGLVNSMMGNPYLLNTMDGPREVPAVAIAGRIAGIDWLMRHIVSVLKDGYRAEAALAQAGFFEKPTFNAGNQT